MPSVTQSEGYYYYQPGSSSNRYSRNKMHQPHHLPVLYAEHCPDEPIIPGPHARHPPKYSELEEAALDEQISRATRVIAQKPITESFYTPKIIRSQRKPANLSYEAIEHNREMKSMHRRINECKNMQQRRKDKTDPIVYPPYFIRENKQAKDVRIDGFSRKIMINYPLPRDKKESRWMPDRDHDSGEKSQVKKSKASLKKYQYTVNIQEPFRAENPEQQEETLMPSPVFGQSQNNFTRNNQLSPIHNFDSSDKKGLQQFTTPFFSHQEPGKMSGDHKSSPQISHGKHLNLPECTINGVLDHIYNKRVFREEELQILRARMLHVYGKEEVKSIWKVVLNLLKRD